MTKWIPTEWLDEVVPRQGDHPDEFLKRRDGVLMLTPLESEEAWPQERSVASGEIVDFSWHEDRGEARLHLLDDGGYRVFPPFPADTNYFSASDDPEDFACNLEELVANLRAAGDFDAREPIDVVGWVWGDAQFRVVAMESGAAHFAQLQPSRGELSSSTGWRMPPDGDGQQ